jgi:glycosyltransferase involved in cell wall biosynthesis
MRYPLISVCVISYNNAKYLSDCIGSILRQTYPNIEVVFCDDASTDDSKEVFEELIKNNERVKSGEIKVNRQYRKQNGGTGGGEANMLTGLAGFTGEYVCNIDSDDVLSPKHLTFLYDLIIKYKADIARVSHVEFNKKIPNVRVKKYQVEKYETADAIGAFYWEEGKDLPFAYWHGLYKKRFAKKLAQLPKKYFANPDSAFSVAQFAEAQTVVQSSCPTIFYRLNDDSVSRKSWFYYLKAKTYNSLDALSRHYSSKISRLPELNNWRNTKCVIMMFDALTKEGQPYKEWRRTWRLAKQNNLTMIRGALFGDVSKNNYKKRLLRKSFNYTPLGYYLWKKLR